LGLNQSTRIDLSSDDSKSFDATSHTEHYRKSVSFSIPDKLQSVHVSPSDDKKKYASHSRVTVRRLKRKVSQQ
jgi:hypothetical protein